MGHDGSRIVWELLELAFDGRRIDWRFREMCLKLQRYLSAKAFLDYCAYDGPNNGVGVYLVLSCNIQ